MCWFKFLGGILIYRLLITLKRIKVLVERLGGKDEVSIDEAMSDEKKAFLMLRIYGDSWKINLGKVFSGINRGKPTLIKKGLKEIKILNKKIEEMIEELV